ncbi:LapA family protein [Salinispirillum sp. LH 10-3-1]|uniref:LapA family protein n=1 Tax=Salinispirillum sp. LH 10-3-1 TaxID=2952525 RepID=A0AB38YBK4_9GAMM
MKSLMSLILVIVLLLVGVGLGLSNVTPLSLSFLGFSTIRLPFFLWLLFATAVGFLIASCLFWWGQRSLRREIKQLRKSLADKPQS